MGSCFKKPVISLSTTNNCPTPVIGNDDKKKEPMIENRRALKPCLKMFTFAELQSATGNFLPDTMVAESGFGPVFKGWVDAETYAPSKFGVGIAIAVKQSDPNRIKGLKQWQADLDIQLLGKFNHPNLVKLLGYCWEDRTFLLVYEYMEKGNLENHLLRKYAEPLSWNIRIKIAIGAAKGLVFLHNTGVITIYRDFKSSDILLDKDFNAKLSDFGNIYLRPTDDGSCFSPPDIFIGYDFELENLGPANGYALPVVDTFYYAAPKKIATDPLYVKNNVYHFGVVLLEIIKGSPVLGTHMVESTRPFLLDDGRLQEIIDPRLENDYPLKGASKASKLILSCLEEDPKNRPSMDKVLASLKQISVIKTNS